MYATTGFAAAGYDCIRAIRYSPFAGLLRGVGTTKYKNIAPAACLALCDILGRKVSGVRDNISHHLSDPRFELNAMMSPFRFTWRLMRSTILLALPPRTSIYMF
jgi:hypothetical protein